MRKHINMESPPNQAGRPLPDKDWNNAYLGISWWDAEKMNSAMVMVVGAGALGNEVLKNLALLNVGNIFIVDFDTIEYSNLSRSILYRESDCGRPKAIVASEQIKRINPGVKVQYVQGDIGYDVGLGVFRRMDVVVGCLDNRLARLYINRKCYKAGKSWVDGGIENLAGQMDVFTPGISCYECLLDKKSWESIRLRAGCPDVARRNGNFGRIPTTPISASLIGALQTQEALKIVYQNHAQSAARQRFVFEGMSNFFMQYDVSPLDSKCMSHVTFEDVVEAGELSASLPLGEVLALLENRFASPDVRIILDYQIVFALGGVNQQEAVPVIIPKFRLTDQLVNEITQLPGEVVLIPDGKTCEVLDHGFPDLTLSLYDLGIPPLEILNVEVAGETYLVELSGDESYINFK